MNVCFFCHWIHVDVVPCARLLLMAIWNTRELTGYKKKQIESRRVFKKSVCYIIICGLL